MKNVIHRARHFDEFGDVVLNHAESRIGLARWRTLASVPVTRLSIGQALPIRLDQVVAQMRPEKSRTSRNYCAQRPRLSILVHFRRAFFFNIPCSLTPSNHSSR